MGKPTKSRALYAQMCLDEKTEVLTFEGWKTVDQIDQVDLVAGFNTETEHIEYCGIENIVDRALLPGESMWGINTTGIDIRVTNLHSIVNRKTRGRKRERTPWVKTDADKLSGLF